MKTSYEQFVIKNKIKKKSKSQKKEINKFSKKHFHLARSNPN